MYVCVSVCVCECVCVCGVCVCGVVCVCVCVCVYLCVVCVCVSVTSHQRRCSATKKATSKQANNAFYILAYLSFILTFTCQWVSEVEKLSLSSPTNQPVIHNSV